MEYNQVPKHHIQVDSHSIASFVDSEESNIDDETVETFGLEWLAFNSFSKGEIESIGNDYFDLLKSIEVKPEFKVLDVGCGSGRWSQYLAPRVGYIEAIDPSSAVISAAKNLADFNNIRVSQASVDNIPFENNSFDMVFSLGVLHHIPDTSRGIQRCYNKIRSGGWFLVYLYYNLENRSSVFKGLFAITDRVRRYICKLPFKRKIIYTKLIAYMVYLPLSRLALFFSWIPGLSKVSNSIPLSYYKDRSVYVMMNDALDRFGTPLEKRFSKTEINNMLSRAGFINIKFSDNAPYWHAIAQKP